MKAEIGVLWPQAKECWQPSEAGWDEDGILPSSLQKEQGALWTP